MVELSGILDSDFLEKCENRCKILGIDTEKPILQVDKYVFAGEYSDTLGTCVIFEEDPDHVENEGSAPQLKYKCHTMKKLSMTRTFLVEKKEGEESSGGVEYIQIKENDFSRRSNLICSFMQQENDDEATASRASDDQVDDSQDGMGQEGNSDLSFELEKPDFEMEDASSNQESLPITTEDSVTTENVAKTAETASEDLS
ncbi:general transcription factor 3C polypeptide 6 isoform X2 [Lissotriton helveticus]